MAGSSHLRLRWLYRHAAAFGARPGLRLVVQRLSGRQVVRVPGVSGAVRIRPGTSDSEVFDQVFIDRQYAAPVPAAFRRWVDDPKIIVDAGANVGYSAIYFAETYPQARILAIEPDHENARTLRENTRNYPNIEVLEAGLASQSKDLILVNEGAAAFSFQFREGVEGRSETGRARTVPGVSVDALLRDFKVERIDILKVDVEGAEREIFSGDCGKWIDRVGMFIIEFHDRSAPGSSAAFYHALYPRKFFQFFRGENAFVLMDSAGPPSAVAPSAGAP